MTVAIKTAKKTGAHVQGSVCYTTSPVHTIEQFTKMRQSSPTSAATRSASRTWPA